MANAVAAVEIEHVPELVSDEIAKASYYKLEQPAPVAKIEDLANCDASSLAPARGSGSTP
jgi:NAD(P)H dehydrogenase (quinone)